MTSCPTPPRPLAVSCLTLRPGAIGGVEQMIVDLLAGLHALGAPAWPVLTSDQLMGLPADATGDTHVVVRDFKNRFLSEELCRLWPLTADHDLLFPNLYTPWLRPRRTRSVTTVVHDLLHRDHPEMVPATRRRWRNLSLARSLRGADRVICISEFTRARLHRHFGGRHRARVEVVPNPVDVAKLRADPAAPRHHPRPYVLSVAHHFKHKNLLTLVEGFKRLAARRDDVDLILVGQLSETLGLSDYSARIKAAIGDSRRIVMTGFVSDAELGVLYRDARLFALPSLYEGFGRPLVEALALGVPVVASDLSVFREISEEAVDFVAEPRRADAWTAALDAALAAGRTVPPALRAHVAARYAPSEIARAYAAVAGDREHAPASAGG